MKIGGSPRRNLHKRLEFLEQENRFLQNSVKEYAIKLLLDFLKRLGATSENTDLGRKVWLVASGRHKGRGVITAKEASHLQRLYKDAKGWWTDEKTFVPDEEWLPRVQDLLKTKTQRP